MKAKFSCARLASVMMALSRKQTFQMSVITWRFHDCKFAGSLFDGSMLLPLVSTSAKYGKSSIPADPQTLQTIFCRLKLQSSNCRPRALQEHAQSNIRVSQLVSGHLPSDVLWFPSPPDRHKSHGPVQNRGQAPSQRTPSTTPSPHGLRASRCASVSTWWGHPARRRPPMRPLPPACRACRGGGRGSSCGRRPL